jgi:PPOX class probable F420-dependent enzyme
MAEHELSMLEEGRVARLATVRPDGSPHLVPVVYAISHDRIVTAIDWKPKSGRKEQRLINIESNPAVTLLVDHYTEEWGDLWWVRVDGTATIHHRDGVWSEAVEALVAKYDQYKRLAPDGAVIAIAPTRVRSWSSRP